jgi:hypothetical protein
VGLARDDADDDMLNGAWNRLGWAVRTAGRKQERRREQQ